jgi:hypothetical protein
MGKFKKYRRTILIGKGIEITFYILSRSRSDLIQTIPK